MGYTRGSCYEKDSELGTRYQVYELVTWLYIGHHNVPSNRPHLRTDPVGEPNAT